MAKKTYPSDEAEKFVVRFPAGSDMRERIAKAADQNGRSMNAELIARLEATFDDPRQPYSRAYAEVAAISEAMHFKLMQWNHTLLRKHDTERRLTHFRTRAIATPSFNKRVEETEKVLEELEEKLIGIEKEIDADHARREKMLEANPKEFGPITSKT